MKLINVLIRFLNFLYLSATTSRQNAFIFEDCFFLKIFLHFYLYGQSKHHEWNQKLEWKKNKERKARQLLLTKQADASIGRRRVHSKRKYTFTTIVIDIQMNRKWNFCNNFETFSMQQQPNRTELNRKVRIMLFLYNINNKNTVNCTRNELQLNQIMKKNQFLIEK